MISIGDLVVCISDIDKVVYKVEEIKDTKATLYGYIYRIIKHEEIEKIRHANDNEIKQANEIINKNYLNIKKINNVRNDKKVIYGTILHIDGDKNFLESCMNLYKEMNIFAWGLHLSEKKVKNHIEKIIEQINPDIIVVTGHDYYNGKGIKDLANYENSSEFIETLKAIRKKFRKDDLTVIIGACSSNFEALIANGANFASSPKRINIHTFDPCVIAIKCATTSYNKTIDFEKTLKYIENGRNAFGGIETKGKMKLLL